MKRILLAAFLMAATTVWAQFGPEPDFDSKYATELVKAGVQAPDFKMKTIDGKTFKVSRLSQGCARSGEDV